MGFLKALGASFGESEFDSSNQASTRETQALHPDTTQGVTFDEANQNTSPKPTKTK